MATLQSARIYATWSGLSSGLTGTNTPPAAAAPNMALTFSGRFSRYTATRAPRRKPRVSKVPATSRTACASAP